jgi:DNA mismatch repair protein MutS2
MPALPSTLAALEFDRVLTLIATEAKSSLGKEAILSRRPFRTAAECELAQSELAEMVRYYLREGLLPLAGLTDLRGILGGESILDLEHSWVVLRAARATQAMRETFVRPDTYPRLKAVALRIPTLDELIGKIGRYFTQDGKLREEASAELRSIRSRVHGKRSSIQRTLNDIIHRSGDAIQEPIITVRGDRYVIPVRSDHRNAVPGILHERSGSGASFFIEPMNVIELNNDLAELMIQEREEIARITRYISQQVIEHAEALLEATEAAGDLDALQACAIFHELVGATRPRFSEDRVLQLMEGRHPLIDERLTEMRSGAFGEEESDARKVVPTTVALDRDSPALVISGPNAGGKTVALKTVGLLVAMGMSGLPVAAEEGTILPVVDDFHVLIGDDQSVLEHLSTFSAYLVRLKRVVERATPRSLVLLDELGSGTDPEEGSALAAAVIEHILNVGCLTIVTTHLSALKSFAVNDSRIVNASMEFDSVTNHPTFRMIAGIPGRSRAIDVAQNIGLPPSIILAARERLGDRYGETDHLLAELQKKMSEVLRLKDALSNDRIEVESERRVLADKTAALEKERARLGSIYRDELDRLKDETGRRLNVELKSLRELQQSARANVKASDLFAKVTQPVDEAIQFIPADDVTLRVGDRAEHRRFKTVGEIVSIDGPRAVLSMNGKRMQVELKDLAPAAKAAAGKTAAAKSILPANPPKASKKKSEQTDDTHDMEVPVTAELNLIGQRVEEAIEESDKFLDRALLDRKPAVRIIHGYGTGTLRKAVREHLRRHPAVRSYRPGDEHEGGDGATIALLDV